MTQYVRKLAALAMAAAVALFSAVPAFAAGESGLRLTREEQDYLANHSSVRVGYVQDRIPVSYTGEDGSLAGISRYVFDRLGALTGLSFQYVSLPSGSVTYDYLLEERLDLVTSVEYNPENLNARGILLSQPYLSSRKVVVAREGLDFRPDAALTVAVSTGSQTLKKVLNRMFPHFTLIDCDSIDECFQAVNSGEADLMIQNQYVVEYWMSKPLYEHLKVIPVAGLEDQLCFSAVVAFGGGEGPAEEEGRLLIGILDKAIAAITEDEMGSFFIQAVMEKPYRYDLRDFLYRYRYAVGIFAVSALVILGLVWLLIRLYLRSVEARADVRAKNQFLSTMSHEIRTPLNGLVGLNYLMSQSLDDRPRLDGYLRQSAVTARYLQGLVSDLLDLSQLQAEKLELQLMPTDLALTLDTACALVRDAMAEKGLTFTAEIAPETPWLVIDQVRVQQVVLNLLDNARKFTPPGGAVRVQLHQERTGATVRNTLTVADTGKGMTEAFQKQVFSAFTQELSTVSKGNQGAGLGLSISRRLARLMGGDLTFTSQPGQGAVFVFTFPGEAGSPPEPPQPSEKRPGRILVAEDNELNAEILLDLLAEEGFTAELAENGRIALEKFAASPVGHFGTILMDLLMPEMDGFAACQAIRALDRPDAGTVKIFACTANTLPADREKARQSGMDDFIAKPVDVRTLLEKLGAIQRPGPREVPENRP